MTIAALGGCALTSRKGVEPEMKSAMINRQNNANFEIGFKV
jgi:hypothetical protein